MRLVIAVTDCDPSHGAEWIQDSGVQDTLSLKANVPFGKIGSRPAEVAVKSAKKLLSVALLVLCLLSSAGTSQISGNLLSPEPLPNMRAPREVVQLPLSLDPEYAGSDVALMVQKSEQTKIPVSLAKRLFSETLRTVTTRISPDHKLKLRFHVTLCLGQKRDYLYVHQPQGTIIAMKNWNEVVFARLVARAVPSSILSEKEADQAAGQAIQRVHATTSVEELKGN